jgi:type II secretory pathway pseudopilin PulG
LASRVTHVLHFTFIELLVVVSIVAIIASLLIPTRASARAKAKLTACAGNLKVLGGAQQSYLNDHGGKVVSGWDGDVADQAERTFWTKIKRYYGDEFLRECPANPQDKLECYGLYSALSGKQLSTTVAKPTGTVLMGENTQLDLESYRRDIEYWTRAGTGHWELGYAHSLTSAAPSIPSSIVPWSICCSATGASKPWTTVSPGELPTGMAIPRTFGTTNSTPGPRASGTYQVGRGTCPPGPSRERFRFGRVNRSAKTQRRRVRDGGSAATLVA